MERKLKVGDRVELIRDSHPFHDGEIGSIVDVDTGDCCYPYRIRVGDVEGWVEEPSVRLCRNSSLEPRKVGDRVRIKSREWYEANKDEDGRVEGGPVAFARLMTPYLGTEHKISEVCLDGLYRLEGAGNWFFSDEMFEPEPRAESARAGARISELAAKRCEVGLSYEIPPLSPIVACGLKRHFAEMFCGAAPEPSAERLPLIESTKLLTDIKLD